MEMSGKTGSDLILPIPSMLGFDQFAAPVNQDGYASLFADGLVRDWDPWGENLEFDFVKP